MIPSVLTKVTVSTVSRVSSLDSLSLHQQLEVVHYATDRLLSSTWGGTPYVLLILLNSKIGENLLLRLLSSYCMQVAIRSLHTFEAREGSVIEPGCQWECTTSTYHWHSLAFLHSWISSHLGRRLHSICLNSFVDRIWQKSLGLLLATTLTNPMTVTRGSVMFVFRIPCSPWFWVDDSHQLCVHIWFHIDLQCCMYGNLQQPPHARRIVFLTLLHLFRFSAFVGSHAKPENPKQQAPLLYVHR